MGFGPTSEEQKFNQAQPLRPFGVTNSLQRKWLPTSLMSDNMGSGKCWVLNLNISAGLLRNCLWYLCITLILCEPCAFISWKISNLQRYIKVLGCCMLCKNTVGVKLHRWLNDILSSSFRIHCVLIWNILFEILLKCYLELVL